MKLARISLTFLSYLSPLIFFLLLLLRFDLSQLFSFFLEAEPAWLLAGAALVPFSVVLLAVCWRFLLVPSSLPFRRLFFVLSRWAMAEQILPVRMSEGVKIFYFGMEDKMGKTRTLSAVFGEEVALGGAKILFFVAVMAGGVMTGSPLGGWPLGGSPVTGWLFWGMAGYTAVVLCLMVCLGWLVRKINPPKSFGAGAPWAKKIRFHLRNWLYQMHAIRNRKYLTIVIALLVCKILVEVAVFSMVAQAFGVGLTLYQSALVIAALYLTILFAVTPGHYGVMEGVLMVVLHSFGLAYEKAFALSISYHLVISVSFVLTGFFTPLFFQQPVMAQAQKTAS